MIPFFRVAALDRVRKNNTNCPKVVFCLSLDGQIRESFVPLIKKAKGSVRYYWLDAGKGEGASLSVFQDKAGVDESVRLAADYVREHMSKLLTQKPEVIEIVMREELRSPSSGESPEERIALVDAFETIPVLRRA
jgi:hypothetical protein